MKANVSMEVYNEEVHDILQAVIERECKYEIRELTERHALEMIKERINEILDPLVVSVLAEEKFDFKNRFNAYKSKRDVEGRIKTLLRDYLNEPTYVYSYDKDKLLKPSDFRKTSDTSDLTRLERMVRLSIERYVDDVLNENMPTLVEKYIANKEELERIARDKMKELIDGK